MITFEADARLIMTRGNRNPTTHSAALGLLLNRVKRMWLSPNVRIKIKCGNRAYDQADISDLINGRDYQQWLMGPRYPTLALTKPSRLSPVKRAGR
jgi:hypothetical protein